MHFELSASFECGGHAPLCYRADLVVICALRVRTKRSLAAALERGADGLSYFGNETK